jgi:hypothetical protein
MVNIGRQKNIFSKIIAVFALISTILPLTTPALTQTVDLDVDEQTAEVKQIPLSEIVDIPRVIIVNKTLSDISRIDWSQTVDIDGEKMMLGSEEALALIDDIPGNIKQLILKFQIDFVSINSTTSLTESEKEEKISVQKQGLQHLIAEKLVENGTFPSNYFELEAKGEIEDASRIIDVTKEPGFVDTKEGFTADTVNVSKVSSGSTAPKDVGFESASPFLEDGGDGMMLMMSTSTENGMDYLLDNQNGDGSWGSSTEKFVTTAAVLDALYDFEQTTSTAYENGIAWIEFYIPSNNSYLAEKIRVLNRAGVTTTAETLAYALNENDGGFVFNRGYQSDVITSAHTVRALNEADYTDPGENPDLTISMGLYYLTQTQNFDSKWSAFDGGVSSIPATVDVLSALLPYEDFSLTGFSSSSIAISDYIDSGISALRVVQSSDGTWGNNLLNTAFSFYIIRTAGETPTFQSEAISYFENEQDVDGSFAEGDLYITAQVIRALSLSQTFGGLIVEDIAPLTSLETGSSTELQILIRNDGDTAVASGTLYILADDYVFGSVDFSSSSISIGPNATATVNVGIDDTFGFVGNVEFTAFVLGTGGVVHSESQYKETLTFSEEPSELPGLPVYFIAQKFDIDGDPAMNVRWQQKDDSNRLNYYIMLRESGTTTWSFYSINNSWNGAFLSPFGEDETYEVTVGALAQDGTRYVYYSNPIEVKTSSDPEEYTGTVSGSVSVLGQPLKETYLDGYGISGNSTDTASYFIDNVPYGSNALWADDFRYESYKRVFVNYEDQVENFDIYTNLIPDTATPTVTNLYILGESDYEVPNKRNVILLYTVDDDIGSGGYGYVQSATFYYYDPNDEEWHLIGTQEGLIYNVWGYQWYIPGSLEGENYQIKVVVRDFSGKESSPSTWGPFEITSGNAPPEFTFIAPSISSSLDADLSYTIKWTDNDEEDNASIVLNYDPDQDLYNQNSVTIATAYEDDFLDQYEWDTSGIATGTYYVRAYVNDGTNGLVVVNATQQVTVAHYAPTPPTNLFTEGQANPTITNATPTFSAIYNDPNATGTAVYYRIQVATSTAFSSSTYWDSDKAALSTSTNKGERTPDIIYGGSELAMDTTYYWRIKLWDSDGHEGMWSTTTATFLITEVPTILTDNFNGYSNGNLNGQGSWSQTAGVNTFQAQGTTTFEGAKAVSVGSGANDDAVKKTGTAQGDGLITFYFYPTNTNYESIMFGLYSGSNLAYWFSMETPFGNYTATLYHGSHNQIPGNYTQNVWNYGQIEWRSSDHTARANLNGGTWTDWHAGLNAWTTLDAVSLETGGNHNGYTSYFDYIAGNTYSTSSSPAPTSPTNLFVEGQTNPVGVTSTTPKFSAIYNDPNAGDSANKYRVQVSTSSSFSSVYWDSGTTTMATTSEGNRSPDITYAGSWLTASTTLYWRILFVDIEGNNGAWSTEGSTFVRANLAPSSPTDLLTEGQTNPVGVTTTAPKFSAIYNDIDPGDSANKYVIQVSTFSSFFPIYWNSGTSTMATTTEGNRSPDISYAGSALIASTTYYWRIKFIDIGSNEGAWSTSTATFSIASVSSIVFDNFNSYSNGNLDGQGSWSQTVGGTTFQIQGTTAMEGTKAVSVGSGANDDVVKKTGTALGDGLITFYFYPTNTNYESIMFGLYSGSNIAYWFSMETAFGNYTASFYHGSHTQIPGTYTKDAWNYGQIQWRSSDNKARANLNGGAWTDWVSGWNAWTTLDTVSLETGGNHTGYASYFDYIAGNPF